jgi:2-dehydropantoate 2-reductase
LEKAEKISWPRIAVMGAGAVGCYFGGMLARAGAPVTLIGRRAHVEAIAREGLFLESIKFQERVAVAASTQPEAVRGSRLVLFCVKTVDNEQAARSIAPHLEQGAIVLSMQNGVDNVARIRAAAGIDALPAVVYVAASMAAPGRVKHVGRGDLVLGELSSPTTSEHSRREEINWIADLFSRAGVPCRITENIEGELWTKMIMNCAWNAVSALGRCTYGRAGRNPLSLELILSAAKEAITVAQASGVRLPDIDLIATGLKLGQSMTEAFSSTAQDIARGKRTEIDSLNGYIVRLGTELQVPTPINFALYALVKLLEEASLKQESAASV